MNERGKPGQAQTSGYFLYFIGFPTLLQTFSAMLFPCRNNNK